MKVMKYLGFTLIIVLTIGLLIPEKIVIPVKGATANDWHHNTFWYALGVNQVCIKASIFLVKNTHRLCHPSLALLFTRVNLTVVGK